jgi:hypothetical protein
LREWKGEMKGSAINRFVADFMFLVSFEFRRDWR